GLWQSCRFPAEDQEVFGLEPGFGIELRAAGFNEPEARAGKKLPHEGRPIRPALPLDVPPIIHARALQLRVVEREAQRLYKVQRAFRGGAEAGHIAGVRRYLRFEEHEVHLE